MTLLDDVALHVISVIVNIAGMTFIRVFLYLQKEQEADITSWSREKGTFLSLCPRC